MVAKIYWPLTVLFFFLYFSIQMILYLCFPDSKNQSSLKREVAKKYEFNIENHKVTIEPTGSQQSNPIPELSPAKFTIKDSVLTVFPSSSTSTVPGVQVEQVEKDQPEPTIAYEMPELTPPREYNINTPTRSEPIELPSRIMSQTSDQRSGELTILLVCNKCGVKFDNTRDYKTHVRATDCVKYDRPDPLLKRINRIKRKLRKFYDKVCSL